MNTDNGKDTNGRIRMLIIKMLKYDIIVANSSDIDKNSIKHETNALPRHISGENLMDVE